MGTDYVILWVLVLANSVAIVLIVRQLALLPQYTHPPRHGPKIGSPIGEWTLTSLSGATWRSADVADPYTLLFIASTCGPCHALLADLASRDRPKPLYMIVQGDADALEREARAAAGPLYELFLLGGRGDLYQGLDVPGTPYAVAVREGRIIAAGVASTAETLWQVASTATLASV